MADEVVMTASRLIATASRKGSPKARVRRGTMRMPPPRPSSAPKTPAPRAQVLRRVRQQSDDAGALERHRQLALVLGAGARLAARLDLRALGQVAAEAVDLLVIDLVRLVGAERAHLPAAPVAVVLVALLGSGNGRHTGRPRLGSEGDGVGEFVAAGGWGGWE